MSIIATRRKVLIGGTALAGSALLNIRTSRAQSGGILEKLRQAGSVKVAIPQTPPWSQINPDGSLAGITPEMLVPVIHAIGIPKIEAISATYPELIPGLQAGRWDIIGADLTISKARCAAVAFLSPTDFGYLAVVYRPADTKNPPLTLTEAGKSGLKIATNSGGFQLASLRKVAATENLLLFEDTQSVLDAVASKRADIGIDAYFGMAHINKNKDLSFTPALSDMGYTASGIAVRKGDTDLYDALEAEIKKEKASGFVQKINEKYGSPYDPEKYNGIDAATACTNAKV